MASYNQRIHAWVVARVHVTELGVLEVSPITLLGDGQFPAAAAHAFAQFTLDASARRPMVEPILRAT